MHFERTRETIQFANFFCLFSSFSLFTSFLFLINQLSWKPKCQYSPKGGYEIGRSLSEKKQRRNMTSFLGPKRTVGWRERS